MDINMLSKAVVQIFKSNKSINLNRKDICGKTPFMNACINGQKEVVKLPFDHSESRNRILI